MLRRSYRVLSAVLPSAVLAIGTAAAAPSAPPLLDIVQIEAGGQHSCALSRQGGVSCWGLNDVGQLGLGATTEATVRSTAVPVPGLQQGVLAITVGAFHSCALLADRSVQCWGLNGEGAVGAGDPQFVIPTPSAVQGLSGSVSAVRAGGEHSCALLQNGGVQCWGLNDGGQLGDGSTVSSTRAVTVTGLPAPALEIVLGGHHSCARLSNGETRCWGRNEQGQLGDGSTTARTVPTQVLGLPGATRALAASDAASCALTEQGQLYCWGPQYPLLAFDGGSLQARPYPGFDGGFTLIEGGNAHICAFNPQNGIKCLGENAYGQFGNGPIDDSANGEFTVGLDPGTVQISAGANHTCARQDNGRAQCWGDNRFGQLGIDSTSQRLVPTPVSGLNSGIAAIGSGGYHGCALTTQGGVKCWGSDGSDQVGDSSGKIRLTPVDVPELTSGVRALAVGLNSSCAITAQRRAKCWGANFQGQLGVGEGVGSSPPLDVVGLGEVDVNAIDVGRDHACALLAGGTVRCWGTGEFGQLGTGSTELALTAAPAVALAGGASAIATGWLHTCALTNAGGVKCWGFNSHGQLGDGSTTHRLTPVDVVGLGTGVTAISAGAFHSCAVLSDRTLRCWGDLESGLLLGDGLGVGRTVPGPVPGLSGIASVSASFSNTCALTTQGALLCWGANDGGPVGDNTTITRFTPVPVPGLGRGVTAIDGGYGLGGHTCAVVSGAALCWGENTFAQLGDGTTHGIPTPQTVLSNEIVRRVDALVLDANAASTTPRFDASGRYVVFESEADNLVTGDSNGRSDVFLRDRETGVVQRVSVDDAEAQLGAASNEAAISADARLIVFVSDDNAPARLLGESKQQREARRKGAGRAVFLRNMQTGSTQRISTASSNGANPQIAANGGAVVFTAPATASSGGEVGQSNIFHVALTPVGDQISVGQPVCVSCKSVTESGADSGANADGASSAAALSADGQWIVYQTQARNALAGQTAPCPASSSQILLRNIQTGASQRISPPNGLTVAQCGSQGSQKPSIDYGGRVIAFQSDQVLSSNDGNGVDDAYLWTADTPSLQRLSNGADGGDTAAPARSAQVSGDGKAIAFISAASNHDTGFADNNDRSDLHVVSTADPANIVRLSRTADGGEADAAAQSPTLNYDASQVGFSSAAQFLAGATGSRERVFARANPLAPGKRSATWWIPSESGWGLTVFDQGNLLAPTWFTYDVDGEPTWFIVAGAFPQTDGSFRGDLFRLTGTPFLQIQGPATQTVNQVGSAQLGFVGDSVLNFDYSLDGINQRKTLQRFPFGPREFVCSASPSLSRARSANYTDLWSGAGADAGWGLTLFHIDASVVAIWYTYDADGEAVFFLITSTRQSDGSFAGEVFRQRNGTPFSQINGSAPSADADIIGSARFQFLDGENATFSFTVNGVSRSHAINRLLVGDQASECRTTDLP